MENYPIASKTQTDYSSITWDKEENKYKYTQTITYWCSQESIDEYKEMYNNRLITERTYNSSVVIAGLEGEIAWAESGEATK